MYQHLTQQERRLEYRHLERISSVFPQLRIEQKHYYTDGVANDIVIINDTVIFRFPKYQWVLDDMLQEHRCLELVRLHSPMRVPSWSIHEGDFISYQKIPGSAMHRWHLFKQEQEVIVRAATELGSFLKELHSIPAKEIHSAGIGDSVIRHTYDYWLKLYDDTKAELYPYMSSSIQDWCETLFRTIIADNSLMDYTPKLIHGELNSSHILFDYQKQGITGIVDFRTAGIGDPASDLAYLYGQYGQQFMGYLQESYGGSRHTLQRARFLAEVQPLQLALTAIRTSNPYWHLLLLGNERGFSSAYVK